MHTSSRKLLLASGLVLALTALGCSGMGGSNSQTVADARQEGQIWTTYVLSPYLRANDIGVAVLKGKATLTGTVDEEVGKELATEIALGVEGIKEVDNKIIVQAGYEPPKSTSGRTYAEMIDDSAITAAIKSKLVWSKNTDGLDTKIATKAGKVTLTGNADSGAAKELASRLAQNTRGVVSVDNQLVVTGMKPALASSLNASGNKAGSDLSDSWITAKVKSTFLYSSNVSGSDIAVSTNNGVVVLTGKVKSGAERALAIELAQNVRGVKVVNAKGLRS